MSLKAQRAMFYNLPQKGKLDIERIWDCLHKIGDSGDWLILGGFIRILGYEFKLTKAEIEQRLIEDCRWSPSITKKILSIEAWKE